MHDLDRLDLNLLKTFVVLLESGSITATAEHLGLAQSSVSHAISRLRDALGDPLFVRGTQGMQPTAMALRLAEPVMNALSTIQGALEHKRTFDPELSSRSFRLLLSDAGEIVFLPRLVAKMGEIAPKVTLVVHQRLRSYYRDALEKNEVDVAIGQLPSLQSDFYQQYLFDESFVILARRGHMIEREPTLENFMKARHVAVGTPGIIESHVRKALGPAARKRNVVLEVRHHSVVGSILETSDLITVTTKTVGQHAACSGDLVILPVPFPMPPVVMRQFWHGRSNADPGCQWLRRIIAELFMRPRKSNGAKAAVLQQARPDYDLALASSAAPGPRRGSRAARPTNMRTQEPIADACILSS